MNRKAIAVRQSVSRPDVLQPFLAIHGGGAAGSCGGDGLAVVGVNDVAASEDTLDTGGRSVVGQRV